MVTTAHSFASVFAAAVAGGIQRFANALDASAWGAHP
jgi:hypothetical protein